MSNNASCNECVFFESQAANGGKVSADTGLCRYNPPVSQPQADARGLWPVVSASDWCGHFTAARKAA